MDSNLNKKFPDCANEALMLIRSNYTRVSKKELTHLAYEFIFFYEFKKEQNTWVKKANPMQELQCADCIMNFLETEKEAQIREYIFDLLFEDIHQVSTKYILQLLLSYSLSMEARQTLDCISKWLIINIGNEIIQNIFDQLITDHFMLVSGEENPHNLINLAVISPLFSSLFMTIVLDMFPNNLISNHEKCLKKLFNLFGAWLEKNPMIPVIAFKANLSHTMKNMFNPLPGLIYVTVLYPLKSAVECFDKHMHLTSGTKFENQRTVCDKKFTELDEVITRVQLMTLKLLKDISNIIKSTKLFGPEVFKLLTLKHLESISKQMQDLSTKVELSKKKYQGNQVNCYQTVQTLEAVREECLDRLAQHLETCWQYEFATCKKQECLGLFNCQSYISHSHDEKMNDEENISLLSIVLNS